MAFRALAVGLAVIGLVLLPAPLYPLAAGDGLFRFYAAVPLAAVGAVLTVLGGALYGYVDRGQ